ncbi:MAG: DUF1007 family protein [Alphaproteobacteria bacterium]|nr:DUF1007 family protein [Alphaproteobacteria bacterium]
MAGSCLWAARPAAAHPHVWIDADLSFVVRDGKVRALDIVWRFDEFFSAQMLLDFDRNRDGRLDAAELQALSRQTQASLGEYSFFTHIRHGERRQAVREVNGFRVEVEKGSVVYRFTVPLEEPADPRRSPLVVGLYDETYFVDIALDGKRGLRLDGERIPGCRIDHGERAEEPIYFGSVYPLLTRLSCNAV